ncbi:MAG: kinase [Thermoplasmatales archaeon]
MLNRLVMTRAPLRVTFTGGGTDLPVYFKKRGYGAVVSAAINKYIYITVNKKFDNSIRVSYSKTEIVDDVEKIEHPTVREALKLLGIENGIEIVSISDIPSKGTGLGSSSSFLVGLLHALHSFKGEFVNPEELAKEAVKIEREILKEPGGKQDQYMAAYGDINLLKFFSDDSVLVTPVISHDSNIKMIEESLLLLYTGRERRSSEIHSEQIENSSNKLEIYDRMRELTNDAFKAICDGDVSMLGAAMHENWLLKRKLSSKISDSWIDGIYESAMKLGALGGKIVGAGGGGFLLLVAEPDKHKRISESLGLKRVDFKFSRSGSRVIFVGD